MNNTELFWLPHGNSDKGWKTPFFEALQSEICLVYGQKMIDFLKLKNPKVKTISIGNFRRRYFQMHRGFYQKRIEEEIAAHLTQRNKNYLYAPTWEDSEGNGSFWKVFPALFDALPSNCNLLVKIHPNTRRRFEIELEALQGRYNCPNLLFLPEFPPIYPLLDISSAYIGDMSSIGYDFLSFDKPLFFIHPETADCEKQTSRFLTRCGAEIPLRDIASLFHFKETEDARFKRSQVCEYTFDPSPIDIKSIFR